MKSQFAAACTSALMLFVAFPAAAEPEPDGAIVDEAIAREEKPGFGGPNSPVGQVRESNRNREPAFRFPEIYALARPWRDWKQGVSDLNGLALTGHYTTLSQRISDPAPGSTIDAATGGVFRATAVWTVFEDAEGADGDTGAFNVMVDHRHAYGDVAPGDLAGQAGYAGVTGLLYGDQGLVVTNLNWSQSFNGRRGGVIVGRYDPSDYMNILGYVNPWATFSNLSILLDSSVAYPDAGWGAAGGTYINDQWYVMAGFNDANGRLDDDLEFFAGGSEFFSWGEIGWTPSQADRYFKNVHITGWHVDQRRDAGIDSGQGVSLAANWTFNTKWMPFVRAGVSSGAEQIKIYERSVGTGVIWRYARADLLGIGLDWGETPAGDEQGTVEAFWRFQFAQNLAFTPSLQYLVNPASNPEDVLLLGFRIRLTF